MVLSRALLPTLEAVILHKAMSLIVVSSALIYERIDNERTMTFTLELDALRRAFINHPHYASFETLLRALPTKQALLDRLMVSVATRRLEW